MLKAIKELHSPSDREYLDQLYREHKVMLLKAARSIVRDTDAAEGVVTDAMLSLFSLVPQLQSMTEYQRVGYLRTTVRRAAYKAYEAAKRESVTDALPLDSLLFSLGTPEEPEDLLERSERARQVHDAIAALPKEDRELLYLRYAADLTAPEIAKLLHGPSAGAVRVRLLRARNKVLALLLERGLTYGG